MAFKDSNAVLAAYGGLAIPDQMIVQALAALWEPASAQLTASCLTGAGMRESPLRAFSAQNVAVRLARLAKNSFTVESKTEVGGKPVRLWACPPIVAETAMRHAVLEGHLLPIAKAVAAQTRGKDWTGTGAGDSPRRRLHLALHAADWRSAGSALMEIASESEPGTGGVFVSQLIAAQPDSSWRAKPSAALAQFLTWVMHDLFAGLQKADVVLDAAGAILGDVKKDASRECDLAFAMAEYMLLQGRAAEAVRVANAYASEQGKLVVQAGAKAVTGKFAEITPLVQDALALNKRMYGGRETLLAGYGGIWQLLGVLADDDPEAASSIIKRLTATTLEGHSEGGTVNMLRFALLHTVGQTLSTKGLPEKPPILRPMCILFHALAVHLIAPAQMPMLAARLGQQIQKAESGGWKWIATQMKIARALAIGEDPEEIEGAAVLFCDKDTWRRGLRALAELDLESQETKEVSRKRIAWLVSGPGQGGDPFVPFALQPVEQVLLKNGQWSKGRNIALSRVFTRDNALYAIATEQDGLVFSTVRTHFDGWTSGYRFDSAAAMRWLVGHPHVFRADQGGARVEVEQGTLELSAAEEHGGCRITLEPDLHDFAMDSEEAQRKLNEGNIPEVAVRYETPTRLRVLVLGRRERRLARIVGDGLLVPAKGRSEALAALARLAAAWRVHSDLPELAGTGEAVEADVRPRFHILPQNPGLKVEMWSHPLGDDGPAYRPGQGGRILAADINGTTQRTTRNLDAEKEQADAAICLCPILEGHEEHELAWSLGDPAQALEFMSQAGELGDRAVLVWPKGGRFRVRRVRDMRGLSLKVRSTGEWFEVDGSFRVDESLVISMRQLFEGMRMAPKGFVAVGEGEYIQLTEELRRQLANIESMGDIAGGHLRLTGLADGLISELEEAGAALEADEEWRRNLARRKDLADYRPQPPAGFGAQLRDYQIEGYQWLARLAELGAGACLADDMGLGKTVQALAILAKRASLGPALVVAPTSVCHNWMTETRRFAPMLDIYKFGEGDRQARIDALRPGDVLITSYSLLRQEEKMFASVHWATCVLDEAQAIKNITAKRSRAAMALTADCRIITTGTPIENHLSELWNLFHFINPHLLGPWRRFSDRFAAPIEKLHDQEAAQRLRTVIRPFILRRTKKQVLQSLPPKTEITIKVEMGAEERAFYESLRRGALERLAVESDTPEKKRFQILAEIMRLRRCCCAPELITGNKNIASAKQEELADILDSLIDAGHKVLVFSQFTDHLAIIRKYLEKQKYAYQYLDGATPERSRRKAVEEFQNGQGDVFLISLKAGGLGLNLTAADYVIHMDPWWNPAVEDQASDRAHRIGQDKPVTVYRLVAAGTIEEKIIDLHANKRDLADSLLAGSDQAAGLDFDAMLRILREE